MFGVSFITVGTVVFFGCIISFIIMLICMGRVAGKYLNGDYLKVTGNEDPESPDLERKFGTQKSGQKSGPDDIDELDEEEGKYITNDIDKVSQHSDTSETKPKYKAAMTKIKREGFEHDYASQAELEVNIEWKKSRHMIIGCIVEIDGTQFSDDAPEEVQFRIMLRHKKKKYVTKTQWHEADARILALSFMLGPIKHKIRESTLRIRVYGRKRGFLAKALFYGECLIPVKDFDDSEGNPIEINKKLLPKAVKLN